MNQQFNSESEAKYARLLTEAKTLDKLTLMVERLIAQDNVTAEEIQILEQEITVYATISQSNLQVFDYQMII